MERVVWRPAVFTRSGFSLAALAVVASLAGLNNGWALKVGGLVQSRLEESAPSEALRIGTPEDVTLIGAALFLGMFAGAPLAGLVVERIGARRASLVGEGFVVSGTLLGAFAQTRDVLIAWRLLQGLGVGFCITAKPLFIVESCRPAYRGRLLGLLATFIYFSFLLVELVDSAMPDPRENDDAWRYLIGVGLTSPVLLAALLYLLPDPPPTAPASTQLQAVDETHPLKKKRAGPLFPPLSPAPAAAAAAPVEAPVAGAAGSSLLGSPLPFASSLDGMDLLVDGPPKSGADSGAEAYAEARPLAWRRTVAIAATLVVSKEGCGTNVLIVYAYDYLHEGFLEAGAGEDAARQAGHRAGVAIALTLVASCRAHSHPLCTLHSAQRAVHRSGAALRAQCAPL